MSNLVDIFISEIEKVRDIPSLIPSITLQILSKEEISFSSRNGGNSLGLTEEDGPLLSKSSQSAGTCIEQPLTFSVNSIYYHHFVDA
jgi:hypothetical protein